MKKEARDGGFSELELSRKIIQQADLLCGQEMAAQKLAAHLSQVGNITYSSQYLKTSPDGSLTVIDKETCLHEIQQAQLKEKYGTLHKTVDRLSSISSKSISGNGYGSITSENGYMQLGLWIAELNGTAKKGDFLIIGVCGWLKTPFTRKVDAISLAIDDFTWDPIIETDNEDVFNLTFQCTHKWADNIAMTNAHEDMMEQILHEKAAQMGINGVFFSYDLPNDMHSTQGSHEYYNMVFMISGTGCLRYPSLPQDFNAYLQYAHLQYALTNNVGFSWESGSLPGVTLDVTFDSQAKYYTFYVPFYGYVP